MNKKQFFVILLIAMFVSIMVHNNQNNQQNQKPASTQTPTSQKKRSYERSDREYERERYRSASIQSEDHWRRDLYERERTYMQRPVRNSYTVPKKRLSISTLSDGTRVGSAGSMTYIIDESNDIQTSGYHSITPREGGYTAKRGSLTYLLDTKGRVTSDGYHEIVPTHDGFSAKIGARTVKLDRTGRE